MKEPLRKIISRVQHGPRAFEVTLECGHQSWLSSGTQKSTHCGPCARMTPAEHFLPLQGKIESAREIFTAFGVPTSSQ